MSDASGSKAGKKSRLRWVTLGEAIAIAALIISGLGLWREYTKPDEKPVVVDQPKSIPLTLRGRAINDGRTLEINPVEQGHALQSLTIITGAQRLEVPSDGVLDAKTIEGTFDSSKEKDDKTHQLRLRIDAKYVEAGADKHATGSYVLSYRWESGGLLGGRSLRVVGMSRG